MRERANGKYQKKNKPKLAKQDLKQERTKARHSNIIAAEKQARGKCAYHLEYFGSDLLVTHDLAAIFEFDHIDRAAKLVKVKGGVSSLRGKVSDELLIQEMAKCELVCANCHRLKTIQNKDWVKLQQRVTQEKQLQLQLK